LNVQTILFYKNLCAHADGDILKLILIIADFCTLFLAAATHYLITELV